MKFTELTSLILTLMAIFLFSACQFIPTESSRNSRPLGENKIETEGKKDQVSLSTDDNPYLAQSVKVTSVARHRFELANKASRKEDWVQAENHLLWLTKNYPELSGPFLKLALLYNATEQFEKAESSFGHAIVSNDKNIYAYNQYAVFLRERGKFIEAEKYYRQALNIWPAYPEGNLNLAILYDLYMGRLELALQHYKIYQSLLPETNRQISGWIIDTQRRLATSQITRGD